MLLLQLFCPVRLNAATTRSNDTPHGRRDIPGRLRSIHSACLMAIGLSLSIASCATYEDRPEINPARWAPHSIHGQWSPDQPVSYDLGVEIHHSAAEVAPFPGQKYDLPALIDLALRNNPQTRQAWSAAQAAADEWGKAQAPFYPQVSFQSDNFYSREIAEVPHHWGALKSLQSRSQLELTYTLIDFGRRDAASEDSRQRLIAANFAFNRAIQETIFDVERSFYVLDAAWANVKAAEDILKLARTDRAAAEQRRDVGLATEPQVLLAREREAQAVYDLENSKLTVSDAQAGLALALGLKAEDVPPVAWLDSQRVPPPLSGLVDSLIDAALRQRPDLSAKVFALRARQAQVDFARADFYPTLSFGGGYGYQGFSYKISDPPTLSASQPIYAATMTVKWDVFTGFDRTNSLRQAEAERDSARAQAKAVELDVAADVWRAYYAFQTAEKKLDYARALMAASQSSYNANFQTYGLGLTNIIDLLTAERDLANAKYTLIASKADLLVAAAAVAFATGTIGTPSTP